MTDGVLVAMITGSATVVVGTINYFATRSVHKVVNSKNDKLIEKNDKLIEHIARLEKRLRQITGEETDNR